MYEHLRNSFLSELMCKFNSSDVSFIGGLLDKICLNYDIKEKETSLVVSENTIPQTVFWYLNSKKIEGVADGTIRNYSLHLKLFFEEIQKQPQDITTNEIRMFLFQYKTQRNISDRTLDKYRQDLNGFFEWCLNEEYITRNPCRNMNKIRYEVTPRKALTRLQLEQVRRLCKTKRDLAIVDVLFSTACRVSELINIKFSDIDVTNNSIHIIGKGNKHNTVYLNTNATLSLQDYIENERQGTSEYIFVSERAPYNKISVRTIQRLFEIIRENLGIKITPHIIRHTTATIALQSGMPITQVQKMLGHSNVATTQIYAETSQEEVAESHRRYVV